MCPAEENAQGGQAPLRRRMARIAVRYAALMLIAFAAFAVVFQLAQPYLIFHGEPHVTATPASRDWAFESIDLAVDGETTRGWYIPLDKARGVIFFCHGNDGNIGTRLGAVSFFRDRGFSVLVFDYGGWGESTGRPSERRIQADTEAMWHWLTETKAVDPSNIVIWGRSFGGGAAAWLGAHTEPAAIVLESTFSSMAEAAFGDYGRSPLRWLVRHRFENREHVKTFQAPLLVIHSVDDELYPIDHGRALFEAAPEPKTFLEIRGGHYDGLAVSRRLIEKGVEEFFGGILPPNPTGTPSARL